MNHYCIKEDKRLPKLSVRFSQEITSGIESVNARNYDNQEALSEWNDYIDGIIRYISNPVIAWDNMNRFHHTSNRETFIDEMGMDVGFIIETDSTDNQYVYVFYLDLKTEDYGLYESVRMKSVVLTELDLRMMVRECVCRILNESNKKVGINGYQHGKWDVSYSDYTTYDFSKEGKGKCLGVRMYIDGDSNNKEITPTYCLFRRNDNGKYFWATIVSAPEKGPKETKFLIVPPSALPREILQDPYMLRPKD